MVTREQQQPLVQVTGTRSRTLYKAAPFFDLLSAQREWRAASPQRVARVPDTLHWPARHSPWRSRYRAPAASYPARYFRAHLHARRPIPKAIQDRLTAAAARYAGLELLTG